MSDKIREFLEVPQQFVRDGNQVRVLLQSPSASLTTSLYAVCDALYKTFAEGYGQIQRVAIRA